jgi:hypothetical protein
VIRDNVSPEASQFSFIEEGTSAHDEGQLQSIAKVFDWLPDRAFVDIEQGSDQ